MNSEKTFQKIADREISGNFVHEDDLCMAIRDIDPQAPTHVLVIPKEPIQRVGEAPGSAQNCSATILVAAKSRKIAIR